jgi:hypothetical protein
VLYKGEGVMIATGVRITDSVMHDIELLASKKHISITGYMRGVLESHVKEQRKAVPRLFSTPLYIE